MAWGQSIAQTLGQAGNDYGRAVDSNIDTALRVIQNKLVSAELQQRMREQDLRIKQMQVPRAEGTYATPQGVVGTTFDPNTGKYGGGLIPGTQPPPQPTSAIDPQAIEQLIGTLPKERQDTVRKLIPIWAATGVPKEKVVAFLQQEAMKEPTPKPPDSFTEKRKQAEADAKALGYTPGTKEFIKKVVELTNPPAAKVTFGVGGKGTGEGGDDSELMLKANMVMNGTPIEKVTTPKTLGKLLVWMKQHDMTPPVPLTPSAQKTLEESTPVHEQIKALLKQFEPLSGDNTPLKYFKQRAEYSMGIQSPIAGAADTIAQLELNRVVGAARVMKGSSRAVGMLQKAMVHLPNVWIDSPKMIYSKLNNLDNALTQIETDAVRYGKKGGVSSEQSTQDLINNLPLATSH